MAESDDDDGLALEENDESDGGGLQLEENRDDDEGLHLEENEAAEDSDGGGLELEDNGTPGPSVAELKASGNLAFREGRLDEAREAYSEALKSSDSLSMGAETNAGRATLLTNRAACALKLSDWAAAINDCTAALSMGDIAAETRNKALYRRATAFLESGDVDGARHDLAQLPSSDAKVTHADIELIVVDTGAAPSPFFTSPSFSDSRVTYLYQQQHQTIGEKRNLAIQHATGDIICHFDDDDLYAPRYIETMVATMEAEDADFVKLSAWLVHDLQTHVTGLFDSPSGMPHPSLAALSEQFLYTYGFSFLYRRALFPTFSFAATSWGEDQDILRRVRDAGKKLGLHRDLAGICLHNQHGENCSRSFAHVSISRPMLEASPLGHLLDALPVIGTALARRGVQSDGGTYNDPSERGQKVVIRSGVTGGLFVWTAQLEEHNGDADATLEAFTHWLWSGNGFSKERYAKLGLARPSPPKEWLAKKAEEERNASQLPAITAGTSYGLEGLRLLEGMDTPHAAGAITNPSAYRDPTRKSAGPQAAEKKSSAASGLLKSFGASSSFGNPTRKFAP